MTDELQTREQMLHGLNRSSPAREQVTEACWERLREVISDFMVENVAIPGKSAYGITDELIEKAGIVAGSPSPTGGEAGAVGEIVSVEGSLGDMHVIKWANDHTPKVGDKLYAHPAPLMDEVGWRSMDSAPKDGTPILITRPTEFGTECGWHVVRWEDDWWTCHDGKFDTPLRGNDPTHWMPLPAAPALTKLQEGGR